MAVPHDPHPSFSSCGVPVVCRRSSLAYAPASPRAPLPESFTLSVPCAQARAVMRAESAALSTYYSAVRPFRERGAPHPRRTMWEAKLPPVMPSRTPPCSPAPPSASDPIPRTQDRTRATAARWSAPIPRADLRAAAPSAWPALARSGPSWDQSRPRLVRRVPCMRAPFATALCAWVLVCACRAREVGSCARSGLRMLLLIIRLY